MRIVYNLRDQDWQTTKSLGILHVSTRILTGLTNIAGVEQIEVLANRSLEPHLAALKNHPRCHLHFIDRAAPRRWSRLIWDHWSVVRTCNQLSPDWLFLPKGFSPLASWPRCRVSAFVHDQVFDYYRRRGLQPFPRGESMLFKQMLRRTARAADSIVTNSSFTAAEFEAAYTPRQKPVRIGAPIAPAISQPASASSPPEATLLLPTSSWPHKLTPQAVAWLQQWVDTTRFTGRIHGFGTLPPGTSHWPRHEQWLHHGRVDETTLARLEMDATALIYFSDYEGYGLPPVEALASGRRAIASDLPPLRETMPPAALFDNADYPSFAATLSHALETPPLSPRVLENSEAVARRWFDELHRVAPAPAR